MILIILINLVWNIQGCSLIPKNQLYIEQSEYEYITIQLSQLFQMQEYQTFSIQPHIQTFNLVNNIKLVDKIEINLEEDPILFKIRKVIGQVVPLSQFLVFDGKNFYYSQEFLQKDIEVYSTKFTMFQDSLDSIIIEDYLIFDQSQKISTIFTLHNTKTTNSNQASFGFKQNSLKNQIESLGQNIYRKNYFQLEKYIIFQDKINFQAIFEKENLDQCGELTNIKDFKTHVDGKISFIDDFSLVIIQEIENGLEQLQCQQFNEKIKAYDYDSVSNEFVVALESRLEFNDQILEIDFTMQDNVKVFILKDYILLQLQNGLEVYDKQLKLIEQMYQNNKFLIQSNSLQNGFIMVDKYHLQKYVIQTSPSLYILPTAKEYEIIKSKLIQSSPEKDCVINLITFYSNTDFSPLIYKLQERNLVSIKQDEFRFCESNLIAKNQNIKLDGKNIYNYKFFQLIPTFDEDIKQFFILQDYRNKIFIFYCNQIEKGCDSWETSFEMMEFTNAQNQLFWVYKQIIYFAFYQFKAFQIYSCELKQPQFKQYSKHDFKQEITSMTTNGNRLFFLVNQFIIVYKIEEKNTENSKLFEKEEGILYQTASSIKPNYLFIYNQLQQLKIYKYYYSSEPTLVLQYKLNIQNIKIVQFQNYFVVINGREEDIYFQVFNYENEIHIYNQRKIQLDFLKTIEVDSVIENIYQNIIYFKGQLEMNHEYVVIALNTNTQISRCLQLVVKAYAETQISQIFNNLVLKYQDQISQIFELDDMQICLAKTKLNRNTVDDYFDLDFDESEFSASTFALSTVAEEFFIYGMYKLYGKKKINYENYDV